MTFWSQPLDDRLTELHGQRGEPSFSVIADKINKEFDTDFSRRACIGRGRRLGLPARRPSNQSTLGKDAMPRKFKEPPKPRVRKPVIHFEPVEITRLRCAEIVPRNLALLDLEPNDCRWPYGDRDITFCAHPKLEGSNYCAAHFRLSVGPGTYAERRATA